MLRSFSSPLACFLIFLFLPLIAYAQRSFTVGTASASPGEKATGYLEVPAGIDSATNIPVVVINGAKSGPVLASCDRCAWHGIRFNNRR
jgi:hypothetical protein